MCIRFVFLLVTVVFSIHVGKASAGCFDSSVTAICNNNTVPDIPHLSSRDPTIMISEETSEPKYCDLFAIDKQTWYKSERSMSTSCPSMYMCGTKFPIWLNGSNPEPDEGIVSRTACLKYFDTCCLKNYSLAAVNCGSHMAYCLTDPPSGCHQRYCFDVNNTGSTKAVFTFSSTKSATLFSKPEHRSTVSQLVSDTTKMSMSTSKFTEISTTPQGTETSSTDTHMTAKETYVKEQSLDKELIIILLACLGLMAATIIALPIVIVRRRRNLKVNDEKANSATTLEILSVPGLIVLTPDKNECPADYLYKPMHYETLKGTVDVMEGLDQTGYDTVTPYQHDYQTIPDDLKETQNNGDLYDDEDRYQTLP